MGYEGCVCETGGMEVRSYSTARREDVYVGHVALCARAGKQCMPEADETVCRCLVRIFATGRDFGAWSAPSWEETAPAYAPVTLETMIVSTPSIPPYFPGHFQFELESLD